MIRALVLPAFVAWSFPFAQAAKIESAPAEAHATPADAKKLPATLPPPPTPSPTPAAKSSPAPSPAPAATAVPTRVATAVSTPPPVSADVAKRSPDEIVGAFFEALKADHVDEAYETLNAEFAMADHSEQARSMRRQTQKALDAYGPMLGYELVREENLGTHLLRRTYVLAGEQLPLRWKFYFYKAADRWKLIDLRIDDAIAEWFDETSKKAP